MKNRTLFTLALALVVLVAPAVGAEPAQQAADTQPVIDQELPEVPALEQQLAEQPAAPAQEMSHVPCIQVITWGKHPGTGECIAFPTPCDVPGGWDSFFSLEECQAAC